MQHCRLERRNRRRVADRHHGAFSRDDSNLPRGWSVFHRFVTSAPSGGRSSCRSYLFGLKIRGLKPLYLADGDISPIMNTAREHSPASGVVVYEGWSVRLRIRSTMKGRLYGLGNDCCWVVSCGSIPLLRQARRVRPQRRLLGGAWPHGTTHVATCGVVADATDLARLSTWTCGSIWERSDRRAIALPAL